MEIFGARLVSDIGVEKVGNGPDHVDGLPTPRSSKEIELPDCHDPSFDRRTCVNCCNNNQNSLIQMGLAAAAASIGTGAAVGAGAGGVGAAPGAIAGGIVGGLVFWATLVAADFYGENCRAKCPAATGGGGGSTGGGRTHLF
jgi:hypothetical protein